MDDKTRAVLADLQQTFGPKKVLTPKDIAPIIGADENAMAQMRKRRKFPLAPVTDGRRIGYSIYDLAEWLARGRVLGITDAPDKPMQLAPPKSIGRPRIKGKYDHLFD